MKAVDALAGRCGESRSRFIVSLQRRIASAKRDHEISAEIDALFSDPNVRAEQRETAELFLSVSPCCRDTVVRQGDVFWVRFTSAGGAEPWGRHPGLVLQRDRFNRTQLNPMVVVARKHRP